MNTNTLLIAAVALGAGYYLKTAMDKNSTPAIGASYYCQRNPTDPRCQGGQMVHTLILPFPARMPNTAQRPVLSGL